MAHPRGVADGVDQRQGCSPAAAKHDELVDLQGLPDRFDIAEQMPCCIVLDRGQGPRAAATALIEDDNAVARGIEELAGLWGSATPGPPMHEYARFTLRIARLFEIHFVAVTDVKPAMPIGLNCGV